MTLLLCTWNFYHKIQGERILGGIIKVPLFLRCRTILLGGEYLKLSFCPVCCPLAVLPLLTTKAFLLPPPPEFLVSSSVKLYYSLVIVISSKWGLWPSPLPGRFFLCQDLAGYGILINSISSERSWFPPVLANLIFSPSGCFPQLQCQERVQGWRTKGTHHQRWVTAGHHSSQSGHRATTNKLWWMLMPGLWVAGNRQASMLGNTEANSASQIAFVFHQQLWQHGWFHLPHKAGTVNRILELFIGHWYRMPNAKLNQVF